MIQDFTLTNENPQNLNSVESVTEQFSTLSVQKVQLYPDNLIEAELQQANLSEDDAINHAVTLINSTIRLQQMTGAIIIRRLLSVQKSIPFQKIIQTNILPSLIQLIPHSNEEFSCEVLWIISNIAAGDKTCIDYLISQRCFDLFNYFLEKDLSIKILEQMMWAIGNIAGEGPVYQNMALKQINIEKMMYLINKLEKEFSNSNIKTIVWCIHNLGSRNPIYDEDKMKLFLPILQKFIMSDFADVFILLDAITSYAIITEKVFNLQEYFSREFLYKILSLIDYPNSQVSLFSLRTIGNYTTMDHTDQEFIYSSGLLPKLINLIESPSQAMRKETYWVLSNIAVENNDCFTYLINSGFFEKFKKTLENDSEDVIREAIWTVCNLSTACNSDQAKWIIENGILDIMLKKLYINSKIQEVILDGIFHFFKSNIHMKMEEISKYSEILENAKNLIGNNPRLESILKWLKEIGNSNDTSMVYG